MRQSFAPYENDEIPVLFLDITIFGSGKQGLLMTDRRVFLFDSQYQSEPVQFILSDIDEISGYNHTVVVNDYVLYNGSDIYRNEPAAKVIKMFVDYCLFLETRNTVTHGSFMEDLIFSLRHSV